MSSEEEREDEEFEAPLPPRVQQAHRARRSALFGLILWPLQIYTVWLLFSLWFSADFEQTDDKDRGKGRRATLVASLIAVPCVLAVIAAVLTLAGFPQRGPRQLDPLELERPPVMCGVWEGKRQDPAGETLITLELKRNGAIRYQMTGGKNLAFTGTWGFAQHGLIYNMRTMDPEDKSQLGITFRWPLEKEMVPGEMVLEGSVRLTKR